MFLLCLWSFIAYLLMAHQGSSKGGEEFLSWGFLSCELGHKWGFTILLISWIWVVQGVTPWLLIIYLEIMSVKISVWPKFKRGGGVNWTLLKSFRKFAFQCENTKSLKKLRMQSAKGQTIYKYENQSNRISALQKNMKSGKPVYWKTD